MPEGISDVQNKVRKTGDPKKVSFVLSQFLPSAEYGGAEPGEEARSPGRPSSPRTEEFRDAAGHRPLAARRGPPLDG
jgi:hypothetical protein